MQVVSVPHSRPALVPEQLLWRSISAIVWDLEAGFECDLSTHCVSLSKLSPSTVNKDKNRAAEHVQNVFHLRVTKHAPFSHTCDCVTSKQV